ncbi:MAG: PAS domain S-box protein, partial [Gammaproteobacteria bacterium]
MDRTDIRTFKVNGKAILSGLIVFCSVNMILLAYLFHEQEQTLFELSIQVEQWAERISDNHKMNLDRQRQLAGLFVASVEVTEKEFKAFANYRMGAKLNHDVVGWVPFSEPGLDDNSSAADNSSNAMKVEYLSGSPRYKLLRDKDFMQLFPSCAPMVEQMIVARKAVVCVPDMASLPPLMPGFTDAFLIATPIIDSAFSEPRGMVFGIYPFGNLMMTAAPEDDLGVYGYLFVPDEEIFRNVFRYGQHQSIDDVPPRDLDDIRRQQFHLVRTVDVADFPLVVAFSTGVRPQLLTDLIDWLAFFILMVSIIGGVEAYYIVNMMQRRAHVQKIAQENASHLKKLIDGSLDALIEIDCDGLVTTWSPAAERIFGWSATEARGQLLSSMIIPQQHREAHDQGLKHHLETGESRILGCLMEFKALAKDGSLRDVEIFTEKVELNEDIYFASFIRDISQRKMTESRNQALLENIPDLAWFKDLHGRFIAVNDAFCRSAGYTRQELIGKTDHDIWPEACANKYTIDDQKVIASKKVHEVTEPLHSSDGSRRWIDTIKRPVLDNHGEVMGTVGIARDVTEMRESQAKLRALSAQQQAIFDAALIGIFFTRSDENGTRIIRRGNKRVRELFGYTDEELIGRGSGTLFANQADSQQFVESVETQPVGENYLLEAAFKRKNGSLFWGSLTGRALDKSNPDRGNVWLIADITQERSAQEQLIRSQRMEAIGQLTGGLAHDFNNLLGIIVANLDLATELEPGSMSSKKYLDIALQAALRGAGLTKKLMAIARKQSLTPVKMDVNQTLIEMRGLLQATVGDDIVLEMSLTAEQTTCMLDVSGFETAILNLVINARDALVEKPSMDDAIKLTTTIVNFDEGDCFLCGLTPGPYVCIAVSDNGPGMAREVLDSAMDAFFTTKSMG